MAVGPLRVALCKRLRVFHTSARRSASVLDLRITVVNTSAIDNKPNDQSTI